ncbi:MAG: FAD:protein FMN transferase [Crocinitomicaceae bacterium]|nr:FAD:protein FMN transferase [Crocinitomicaceae bacterium]
MFGKRKHKAVSWFAISCSILVACQQSTDKTLIRGEAQGTTYTIILPDKEPILKESIDSLLKDFDQSLSTYDENSLISQINAASGSIKIPKSDSYFSACFQLSKKVHQLTEGAFDPTVFPLIKAWGFFKEMENVPTDRQIDSLLIFTGFDKVNLTQNVVEKRDERVSLDFNAIAQGLSVDVVCEYLQNRGVLNYFVEIGGEIRVKGFNPDGNEWRIGVDVPTENPKVDVREIQDVLELTDGAVATSGNYRKFYIKDGKKYAHTLDPKTGRPAENDLLSATVIAQSAGLADGLATAFMVMGTDKTKNWLTDHPEIKVYLISRGKDGKNVVFQN